jgi:hypothetical protein
LRAAFQEVRRHRDAEAAASSPPAGDEAGWSPV